MSHSGGKSCWSFFASARRQRSRGSGGTSNECEIAVDGEEEICWCGRDLDSWQAFRRLGLDIDGRDLCRGGIVPVLSGEEAES